MKKVMTIVLYLIATFACGAQLTVLEKVWVTSPTDSGFYELSTRVEKLVSKLERKRYRNEARKLYALFAKTHKQFLHDYVQYTGIEDLAKGDYDCLTATSLFAHILSESGYTYKIIETNYHIFIMVNTTDGDVILETTDRLGGFIRDKKKMNMVISEYKKNLLASASSSHYLYTFKLYQPVNADQLPGLLYFNQAVKAFNDAQWLECSDKLSASLDHMNSPRVAELAVLLYNSVSQSTNIDKQTKATILNKWKGIVLRGVSVASR